MSAAAVDSGSPVSRTAGPVTKFRAPRLRDDMVARPGLLAQLVASVATNPVTVIVAPGGSGKTTLLSQLAAGLGGQSEASLVWVSLDADDDYPDRFFAVLVEAVSPIGLAWDCDPRALVPGVGGEGAGRRAALAAFVNALCTAAQQRVVLVLDDLHRLASEDVFRMLEALVERLPDNVAVVLGSRVEPPLPLARWRAHAELGEIGAAELCFTQEDATRLALLRGAGAADPQAIEAAVTGAGGWAVGVCMLLKGAPVAQAVAEPHPAGSTVASRRHLFAYLAQEILAELAEDLQRFVLECSILDEMSPALCAAVTGREDSGRVLETLYRRNLFLTVVDESMPVLRFHDLFRDFLVHELGHRFPGRVRELHERAARVEPSPSRAIEHLLKAESWAAAIDSIVREGQPRLVAGGIAAVENWLDRIPRELLDREPRIGLLRGACAWLRWDWLTARRELSRAIDAITDPADLALHVRSLIQLIDALNSSGDPAGAMQRLEQAAALPLEDFGRAEVALLRAWCLARERTDAAAVLHSMQEFIGYVERDPARICAATAGRIHCMLVGVPGMADVFARFADVSRSLPAASPAPWHVAALVVGAWSSLWRGEREQVAAAIEQAEAIYRQFGGIRLFGERIGQLKAIYCAAVGDSALAESIARQHIEGLSSPEVAWHREAWQRSYRHALARMLWMAGRHDAFLAELPLLLAPRTAAEWPFVDTAMQVVRGQAALLNGDLREAERLLREACTTYAGHRMSMIFCDPRISLAAVQCRRGDRLAAWRTFAPVYEEVLRYGAYGLLILDAPAHVAALLDAAPAEIANSPQMARVRSCLERWRGAAKPQASVSANGPLAALTDREAEVLERVATGASNKEIARELMLSLHTVKRHIANILDKLDCDSRGQAADLLRRRRG